MLWTLKYRILNLEERKKKSSATYFFSASTKPPFKEHDQWKITLFPLTATRKGNLPEKH